MNDFPSSIFQKKIPQSWAMQPRQIHLWVKSHSKPAPPSSNRRCHWNVSRISTSRMTRRARCPTSHSHHRTLGSVFVLVTFSQTGNTLSFQTRITSLLEVLYSADDTELDNSSSHYCSCLNESVESAAPSDWKEPFTPDETTDRISIPDSVKALTDSELRRRLQQYDERPGPIVKSTRRMYEIKLAAFLKGKPNSRKTQPGQSPSMAFKTR